MPYLLALSGAADQLAPRALELLDRTDVIASTPHALEAVVEPYVSSDAADSDDEEKSFATAKSSLLLLQAQLQHEATRGWALAFLPRPYDLKRLTTVEVKKHPVPHITIPNPVNPGPKALFPEAYFSVYADQDVEVFPPPLSHYLFKVADQGFVTDCSTHLRHSGIVGPRRTSRYRQLARLQSCGRSALADRHGLFLGPRHFRQAGNSIRSSTRSSRRKIYLET